LAQTHRKIQKNTPPSRGTCKVDTPMTQGETLEKTTEIYMYSQRNIKYTQRGQSEKSETKLGSKLSYCQCN